MVQGIALCVTYLPGLSVTYLAGSNPLTITNWQNAVDFFTATNWAGVTPNTIGGSITNQV